VQRCKVFDNINNDTSGYDTIGCTLLCGSKSKIDNIFWCGSILDNNNKNINKQFTSTIIQVCAGVLSGLSYILENKNKNIGLINPCDMDTIYILNKSKWLLGKFFIAEVDTDVFSGDMKLYNKKII